MDLLVNLGKLKFITQPHEANSQDIFNFKTYDASYHLESNLNFSSVNNKRSPVFSLSMILPKNYDFYISNFCFSFRVPAIIGKGRLSYCDYFGYSAIDTLEISIGHSEFTFNGDMIYEAACKQPNFSLLAEQAGHRDECRRIDTSLHSSQTIKDSQLINVLIPLPFGDNIPKNLLKLAANDEIVIKVHLKPIGSLLNYNTMFNLPQLSYSDYNLKVKYIIKDKNVKLLYEPVVTVPVEYISSSNYIRIPMSHHLLFKKDYNLSSREYLCLFGNWQTSKDVIDIFKYNLMKNILFVTNTDISNEFPKSAILLEVINGRLSYDLNLGHSTIRSYTREIIINIKNIPKDHKLYFLANSLIIKNYRSVSNKIEPMKYESDWFNLSEKIIEVHGSYDSVTKKIIYHLIRHRLTTQHASIPLDVYKILGQVNLRNDFQACYINCYFVNGINMFKPNSFYDHKIYIADDILPEKESNKTLIYNDQQPLSLFHSTSPYSCLWSCWFAQDLTNTRFKQKTLSSHINMILETNNPEFILHKNEYNCTLDVTSFNEVNHTEEGFEAFFDQPRLIVYIFNNYSITHEYVGESNVSVKRQY